MTPLNSPETPSSDTQNAPSSNTVGLDILSPSDASETGSPQSVLTHHKDQRKSKIALIVAGILVLLAIGGLVLTSIIASSQESSERVDALELGASAVEDWMVSFEDIGDNTIILGAPNNEDDSNQSIALQDLKASLESNEGLEGIRVELEPGKQFEFVDNDSGVVLMSNSALAEQGPAVVEVKK